jgi:sterol desaturase/sphingolipid hydroxylase (fatty acid hydroxylase superfamily)
LVIFDIGYYWFVFWIFTLGRYFLMAGIAFWLFYAIPKTRPGMRSISPNRRWKLIRQDIALSSSSALLFALLAAVLMTLYKTGGTRLYEAIDDYGWTYLGLSFVAILILQDTYFYFFHRLLHHPRLFRWMHQGHHRSRFPTPWTSFAFEPGEALIHGLFFAVLVYVVPLHFYTLIAALMTMTLWAIATHLGFELLPPHSPYRWLTRGFIGPSHHGIHHRHHHVHFGLYFTFWDRVCGTSDPQYLANYGSPPQCRHSDNR